MFVWSWGCKKSLVRENVSFGPASMIAGNGGSRQRWTLVSTGGRNAEGSLSSPFTRSQKVEHKAHPILIPSLECQLLLGICSQLPLAHLSWLLSAAMEQQVECHLQQVELIS